jgi:hypothetical protein
MQQTAQSYDNPLTRYKKEIWSLCTNMHVFDHIPKDKVNATNQVFENVISNYQSQILQQENDAFLKQTILAEISKEVEGFKQTALSFDQKMDAKQHEFDSLMNKNVPETPHFGDENGDEPIEKENLDALIQQQMEEREQVMNINDDKNTIVSDISPTTSPVSKKEPAITTFSSNYDNQFIELQSQIQQMQENIKIQTTILQQIVHSQIAILNKLK